MFGLPQVLYATLDGIGAGGVALLRRSVPARRRSRELRNQEEQGGADREHEGGGDSTQTYCWRSRRGRSRLIVDAAFLAEASGDLQPDVIGWLRIAERVGHVADAPEVVRERAARVALVEMAFELRRADRSRACHR